MNNVRAAGFSRRAPRRRQGGFSFFEVLVAALILAIGVLGFVGLQVRAMDTTGTAHFRAQAAVLAAELAERVRMVEQGARTLPIGPPAHPGRATNGLLYAAIDWPNLVVPAGVPAGWAAPTEICMYTNVAIGGCTATQVIASDARELKFMAAELLPDGDIRVERCVAGSARLCVYVGWLGQDPDDCELGDGNINCMGVEVLP